MHRPDRPLPRHLRVLAFGVGCIATALAIPAHPADAGSSQPARQEPVRVAAVEPVFVPNDGAFDASVRFVLLGGPSVAWLTDDGVTFGFDRVVDATGTTSVGAHVRLRFGGDVASRRLVGEAPVEARVRVLRAGASAGPAVAFARVRIVDAWPGIDVVVRPDPAAGARGAFAYDLHAKPGADLALARIVVEGVDGIEATADGALRFSVPLGDGSTVELQQRAPIAWVAGARGEVARTSRIVVGPERTFGFEVDGWDGSEPLVVDPGFTWVSYLGGGASDTCRAVRVVADGVLIGGWAGSTNFPTTVGAYRATGRRDAFVAKLAADGSRLVWSTYLGGSAAEEVDTIDVAADGSIVVGGWTGSIDFPVTAGVVQPTFGFGSLLAQIGDGFVTKLTADGSALVWSTYLGRLGDDFVRAVRVLDDGSIVVAGDTNADAFPTTAGVFQPTFGSGSILVPDAFVTKLSADASRIVWSTYFGGFAQELVHGLAIAPDGSILIAGLTASLDLTTTAGAYQREVRGSWDGFVAKIRADGAALLASTLFGGDSYDHVRALALDPHGDVWLAGVTGGTAAFPASADAFQSADGGLEDGYVARLSGDLTMLRAATLLGGSDDDVCEDLTLDLDGSVLVVGTTSSPDFPVGPAASQPVYGGGLSDGFVARLDASMGAAPSIGFVGGSDKDQLLAVGVFTTGDVLLAGTTWSANLGTTAGVVQPTFGGTNDAFLVRVALESDGQGSVAIEPRADAGRDRTFAAGATIPLVAGRVRNTTDGAITLEAVEVAVGVVGAPIDVVTALSLYVDVDGDGAIGPGDTPLATGVPMTTDGTRVRFAATWALDRGASLALVVGARSRNDCPAGAEFTARIVDVTVRRARDGRRPVVAPPPVATGAWIRGTRRQFNGDVDGDGAASCRDVRALVARLAASTAVIAEDANRNGAVDATDVSAVLARCVARAPAFLAADAPAAVAGGVIVVEGYDLGAGVLTATLDGRSLTIALRGPRGVWLDVPPDVRRGSAVLRVVRDGRLLCEQQVDLR